MRISDVLRSLVDVVDRGSADLPDAPSHADNTSDFTAFTGDLKPVELPDVQSATRVDRTEKTAAGNDVQPDELFIPPLQMKMELLKKATDVANIYDDGPPDQQEQERSDRDGAWDGANHSYEYVGASTGVLEGGSEREETVTESERMRKYMKMVETDKADRDYDGDGEIESEKDEVWGSRMRAAKKAGKMDEGCHDEEQLDELSRDTLKSYAKKANQDSWFQGRNFEKAADKGDQEGKRTANRKSWNRHLGIDRAMDRLEEEPVNELSRPTLKDYIKKAAPDQLRHGQNFVGKAAGPLGRAFDGKHPKTGEAPIEWDARKMSNRGKGIDRAVDRLEELSPDTLQSYKDKAEKSADKHFDLATRAAGRSQRGGKAEMDRFAAHSEKFGKRKAGIDRASSRLGDDPVNEFADAGSGCDWQSHVEETDTAECSMSRLRELAGMREGDDFEDDDLREPTSYDLGYEEDDDYEPDLDDLSDLAYHDDEDLWESDVKRIRELANPGVNPVILDALTDDLPEG